MPYHENPRRISMQSTEMRDFWTGSLDDLDHAFRFLINHGRLDKPEYDACVGLQHRFFERSLPLALISPTATDSMMLNSAALLPVRSEAVTPLSDLPFDVTLVASTQRYQLASMAVIDVTAFRELPSEWRTYFTAFAAVQASRLPDIDTLKRANKELLDFAPLPTALSQEEESLQLEQAVRPAIPAYQDLLQTPYRTFYQQTFEMLDPLAQELGLDDSAVQRVKEYRSANVFLQNYDQATWQSAINTVATKNKLQPRLVATLQSDLAFLWYKHLLLARHLPLLQGQYHTQWNRSTNQVESDFHQAEYAANFVFEEYIKKEYGLYGKV